jgi:hypothetical protein
MGKGKEGKEKEGSGEETSEGKVVTLKVGPLD